MNDVKMITTKDYCIIGNNSNTYTYTYTYTYTIGIKAFPIGWNNYIFAYSNSNNNNTNNKKKETKKTNNNNNNDNDDSVILEMFSINPNKGIPLANTNTKRCKFMIEVKTMKKKSKVKVILKSASIGINHHHMSKITKILEEFFQLRFSEQVDIAISRTKMQMNYNRDKKTDEQRKKRDRLDRLINPDKYKSKSSTVRRVREGPGGGGGGSGRYTPSAATQARRVVKRG
jgi:hypothetical protein